jgi:hypothetical protein
MQWRSLLSKNVREAAACLVKVASIAQPPVGPDVSHSGVVDNLDIRKTIRLSPATHHLTLTEGVALQ